MLFIFASTPLLLVNLLFAAIALAVGFAAGVWICGDRQQQRRKPAAESEEQVIEQKIALERTMLASDRLRDLASSVATDVGAHSASINQIEAQLASDRSGAPMTADSLAAVLGQIEKANTELQVKLTKAEQQIQAQAEQIRTQESEARTDSLTGIANRRAFDDEIRRRFSEWDRNATPFSLLILDVDHFKLFNDSHGHQAGDEVLRRVAETIASCAREMDLPCRYGGEEFAVVLPATVASDAHPLAERLRASIEGVAVPFEGKSLSVTASIGLAGVQPGDAVTQLVKRADDALYASKEAGRNNAHRHTGECCLPITPGYGDDLIDTPVEPAPDASAEESPDALPNRTRFLELLRGEVRLAQGAGAPLALLTAELQGYRKLAEEFGDSVAQLTADSVAQFLQGALRPNDVLGRFEDGLFVVMMPNFTAKQAKKLGERINTALANCAVPLGDTQLELVTALTTTELTPADTAVSFMQRSETAAQQAQTDLPIPQLG